MVRRTKSLVQRYTALVALLVSVVAVVLSQLHPLYTYLDKPKVTINLNTQLSVSHNLGNIVFNAFIQVGNPGRAAGKIARISLMVERNGGSSYRKIFPCQTIFLQPSAIGVGQTVVQIPMSPFNIAPDANWSNWVSCFATTPKEQESKVAALRYEMRSQLLDKINAAPPGDKSVKRVDEALAKVIDGFVAANMTGFVVGNYDLLLLAWTDESADAPGIKMAYTFSVFEGDVASLGRITDGLHEGFGIVISPNPILSGFSAQLSPISDTKVIDKLTSDYEALR